MSIPPKSVNKLDLDQAWYRLIREIRSGALVGATWDNLLLVDKGGNDATALRGSLTQKFATIQAALDAAQEGDTVWVGPGFYAENITWPETNRVTLQGFGATETAIVGSAGATVLAAPNTTVALATIRDLAILSSDGSIGLHVSGFNAPDSFDPLTLQDVNIYSTAGVTALVANSIDLNNVFTDGTPVEFTTVSKGRIVNCRLGNLSLDYDPAVPVQSEDGPGGVVVVDSTTLANVIVLNLARIVLSKDTQSASIFASLIDDAMVPGPGAYVGSVWCFGKVIGNVDIQFAMTEQSGEIGRFDYAEIGGLVSVVSVGGTESETVNMRNAILHATPTAPDPLHSVGLRSVLDLRGSLFTQHSLSVTDDGAIDRTNWFVNDLVTGGAGPLDIVFDIPYPSGNYTVLTELSVPPDSPVVISNKLPNKFTRTKASDDGDCRHLIVRPFE